MARRQEWTVRVVEIVNEPSFRTATAQEHLSPVWKESLRYMGHCRTIKPWDGIYGNTEVVEFYAPKGHDSKVWSEQNAERMKTFGINAAAAPKWGG